MRNLEPRTNFNFNGRWLSEFKGVLYNESECEEYNILPNYTHTTQDITNIGKRFIGKVLEPKIIPLSIFFEDEFDADDFINWIDTDEPKLFYYDDSTGRQIECILNSGIDLEAYFNKNFNGKLNIEMIAYIPYWTEIYPRYLDIENPVKGQAYNIYYDGNEPSRPIIYLECVGEKTNISIGFNDYEIEIDRFTQNLTIDMRYGKIYSNLSSGEVNKYASYKVKGGFHEREMIDTKPNTLNSFRIIRGDIKRLKITPNIRWR